MKYKSPQIKTLLNHCSTIFVFFCLLAIFSSCKGNKRPEETIPISHTETKSLNAIQLGIVGKWKMDSIWTLKNNKKTKPRVGLINIFWTFDQNNYWHLESKPVNAKIKNLDAESSNSLNAELSNPLNKLKSKYTITDSILTIKSLNLKYRILEIDSSKIYMQSLGVINEAYKFVSVEQ